MSDLVERLRAHDARWQEYCDRWEPEAKAIAGIDLDMLAKMRRTIEAEAADEITALRAALSQEREAREKAEAERGAAIARYRASEADAELWQIQAEGKQAAEASLAEAKRLLKPFANLDAPTNPKWDCGTFLVMHVDIRAAARFLAQEAEPVSPKETT